MTKNSTGEECRERLTELQPVGEHRGRIQLKGTNGVLKNTEVSRTVGRNWGGLTSWWKEGRAGLGKMDNWGKTNNNIGGKEESIKDKNANTTTSPGFFFRRRGQGGIQNLGTNHETKEGGVGSWRVQ